MLKELPNILENGNLISFKRFKGRNIVSVNTNRETLSTNPNKQLKVVFSSKSISYLEVEQNIDKTIISFEISSDRLTEGISRVTLYDNESRPQSERLIYNEKEHDLSITINTDKTIYHPNERAVIFVSSTTKSGEPTLGSYSLSVTDMNGVAEDQDYESNICSYFLMESDIRGQVYNPGYYFNSESLNRLKYLDNLLLTQGWRDFLWKTKPELDEKYGYEAEKGFTISGKLKQVSANKPLIGNDITLGLMSKHGFNAFSEKTDSLECFKFEKLMFFGNTNLYLNSRNDKGKFSGFLILDSLENSPMKATFQWESGLLKDQKDIIKTVYDKYIEFGVPQENILDEIEINTKKNDVNPWYGDPDYSYEVDNEEANKYYNFVDYLVESLRIVNINALEIRGKDMSELPFAVLIDGFEAVHSDQLFSVSPNEALKVEVISRLHIQALYGKFTVISVKTNAKTGQRKKIIPVYSAIEKIEGFYEARIFYEPNSENDGLQSESKAAVRNTIYWNPYLYPYKKGKVVINYYNSKVETKVKVSLEGITGNGIPVVKKEYYSIQY